MTKLDWTLFKNKKTKPLLIATANQQTTGYKRID